MWSREGYARAFIRRSGAATSIETAAAAVALVVVRRRPVVFREGEPPLVGLFALMRADDLPELFRTSTWVEPPLIIRTADGSVHPEYAAVKLAVGFPP
jgi:hypothetical protein